MTLEKTCKGQLVTITSIPNDTVRAQAIRFGIAEGEKVVCQEVIPLGPVILQKNKQEIAVGRKLACQIQVEPVA